MSKTDLTKFELRLGLAAYFMHLFGVSEPTRQREVRSFFKTLNQMNEGYDGERSYVARHLASRQGCQISADRLFVYDGNIRQHLLSLNERRSRPIVLKYFQMLAALCAEHYLDRLTDDPDRFRHDINRFLRQANEDKSYHYQFELFDDGDLNKLAYWMATGSGKTLVMHLNYYQWVQYSERLGRPVDNILLLTPNAGLTRQHIEEMRLSSIPCRYFHDAGSGHVNVVKVLEITKLSDDPSGSGESIEVDAFEGNNLIFVDEGHKGASGDAWMDYRRRIAKDGFTFEYSATFGQAIAGSPKDLQLEYGQAIALNYSYPYFHEDGYGKDYHILNLDREIDDQLTDRYLLANLLTFLEQKLCFVADPERARGEYNIQDPLLMFVGNSVTAGKTLGSLTTNEERSLTDVQKLVLFLDRVLRNRGGWVEEAVEAILAGSSGLDREDGTDLFDKVFPYLKGRSDDYGWDGKRFYEEMLKLVFQTDASAPLHLVNLENADGELGLRAGSTDRYFGVIDIGNERAFLSLAEAELPEVETDSDTISSSLFQQINQKDSDVQILLGSRKFIEGWSSWRVSAMGLMNFGQSPGPMIIQLFGRGVRLLGKNRSLQRSRAYEGGSSKTIELLETLHIFGVRARYMSDFRKYLEREGIDVDEWEDFDVPVPVKPREEILDRNLPIPKVDTNEQRFTEDVLVRFQLERALRPRVDLRVTGEDLQSAEDFAMAGSADRQGQRISSAAIALVDWDRIVSRVWQHARAQGYTNLAVSSDELRRVLQEHQYNLECPDSMVDFETISEVRRIERIIVMILTKYVDNLVSRRRKEWEDEHRKMETLGRNDPNLPRLISVRAKRTAQVKEELEELEQKLRDEPDELFEDDGVLPPRVHFSRHLYAPLLLESDAAPASQLQLKFSPPGLNAGELRFVRELGNHLKAPLGHRLLQDFELFLLRNQSRGAGVSFGVESYEDGPIQTVYPDFIIWLDSEDVRHIVFVDPHGLAHSGNIFGDPKVRLHKTIKKYEEALQPEAGSGLLRLHSFVVSTTKIESLPNAISDMELDRLRSEGVYFPDEDRDYLTHLFERVLEENHNNEAEAVPADV